MAEERNKIPPAIWARVFQTDRDGAAILEELALENVFVPTFDSDPIAMARKAARQELILEIMGKAGQ